MEPLKPDLQDVFLTDSPEQTSELGARLGRLLRAGDFVGLSGELGAGKTRFVRGVASGAEVPPTEVASPTFAIVYPYEGKRVRLHHADLYRLADPDELFATGFFDLIGARDSAMLVEWIEKIPNAVPPDALLLALKAPDDDRPDHREVTARSFGPRSTELLTAWRESA